MEPNRLSQAIVSRWVGPWIGCRHLRNLFQSSNRLSAVSTAQTAASSCSFRLRPIGYGQPRIVATICLPFCKPIERHPRIESLVVGEQFQGPMASHSLDVGLSQVASDDDLDELELEEGPCFICQSASFPMQIGTFMLMRKSYKLSCSC